MSNGDGLLVLKSCFS